MNTDSIVLLAKKPGLTSFASLRNVKKALGTNKVGHTGTLDSFAQGLLVVCSGHFTKLCGQITAFNKTYEAVIHFGCETDTCEYTGETVKNAPLPAEGALREAVKKWTGDILQKPPLFSAIHIDGKRASDLIREGKEFDVPERPVTVFSSEIKELSFTGDNLVEFARIEFSVSKGTYIRSLARDIARECGSAAYLTGLFRTRVGNFNVEDSAGFSLLPEFNIKNAFQKEEEFKSSVNVEFAEKPKGPAEEDLFVQNEICSKSCDVSLDIARLCGFETLFVKEGVYAEAFKNGKPLKSAMFEKSLWDFPNDSQIAVFEKLPPFDEENLIGLINKNAEGKVSYGFVIN